MLFTGKAELSIDAKQRLAIPAKTRSMIEQALKRSRGSLGKASRLLGISYKTMQYRVRKFDLDRDSYSE